MFISAIVHTLFSGEFPFNMKSKILIPVHFNTRSLITFCFTIFSVCRSFSNQTLSWNTHFAEQINKYKILHKILITFCTGKHLQIKNLCIFVLFRHWCYFYYDYGIQDFTQYFPRGFFTGFVASVKNRSKKYQMLRIICRCHYGTFSIFFIYFKSLYCSRSCLDYVQLF